MAICPFVQGSDQVLRAVLQWSERHAHIPKELSKHESCIHNYCHTSITTLHGEIYVQAKSVHPTGFLHLRSKTADVVVLQGNCPLVR